MPARLLAAVAALALATGAARTALDAEASRARKVRDPAWLPEGKLLRATSFGQRLALSDLYWLDLVQYVGETVLSKTQRWDALYPLADIVTDLDPRYGYAYQVAGSNLAGVAGRTREADAILRKGIKNVPDRWSLYWTQATNKFLYDGDYKSAAEYARQAAVVGKRPELALLAANLSAVVDSEREYRTALDFLDRAIADAGTEELKAVLAERRSKIATYEALSELEKAIAAYRRSYGRPPLLLSELLVTGLIPELPDDPSGGKILYDPTTGQVRSSVWGPRAPIRTNAR